MESGVVSDDSSFVWAFLLTLVFIGIYYFIQGIADVQEIKRNWPKYRCSPSVLPFASLYGYDIGENFNYCIQSALTGQMGQFTGPFATILQSLIMTSMTFLQNLNSLRVMFSTLLGGITKMLQELTDRIRLIMTQIRTTSLRMQALMQRTFAVFYAMIYMGLSAVQTGRNFGNTIIFKFMDTFCFEEDTRIHVYGRGLVPIHTIQLGERLGKYRNGPIVTSTYRFMADGQPMIRFEPTEAYPYPILVSSNHYMYHNYKWIRADEHPDGHKAPDWAGGDKKFLYCLDTNTHEIPIGPYIFLDYDETDDSDDMTMKWIEKCVNGKSSQTKKYPWRYQPCCDPDTLVQMKNGDSKPLHAIRIGDRLTTGLVTGIVTRNVYEYVTTMRGTRMTPSTLIWTNHTWERAGIMNSDVQTVDQPIEMVQLVVMHASMFETTTGDIIRDFVEIHHPEAELETTKALSDKKTKNTS